MNNQRLAARLAVILVTGLAAWFLLQPSDEQHTETPTPNNRASNSAPNTQAASNEPTAKAPTPGANKALATTPREAVFNMVHEGRARIQCDAPGGVPDAVYRSRPSVREGSESLLHPTVEQGNLMASVTGPSGEVLLERHLQVVGVVRWSGAVEGTTQCTFTRPPRVTLRGTVSHADGSPAVDVLVRGCDHGELIRTNAEGRFTMKAPLGARCMPMAFDDSDNRFGKGSYVDLKLETEEAVDNIELRLPPPENYWTAEKRVILANQLAKLNDMLVQDQHKRINALMPFELTLQDPEAKALVEAWIASEEERIQWIESQTELLLDPESMANAVTESFLGQY